MFTLQIEHRIKDFAMWKAAFDRDPVNRAASGVTAYRINQPVDDGELTHAAGLRLGKACDFTPFMTSVCRRVAEGAAVPA